MSGWLEAFQEVQRHNVEVQLAFQKAMAESHQMFLTLAENSIAGSFAVATVGAVEEPEGQRRPPTGGPDVTAPARSAAPAYAPAAQPAAPAPEPLPTPPPVRRGPIEPPPRNGAVADGSDVRELLLAVVSDKTGYPAKMLQPETEPVTELGIDSTKWAQILSALREQVPDMPEVRMAELSALRSLGALADALAVASGTSPFVEPPLGSPAHHAVRRHGTASAAPPTPRTQHVLTRHTVEAVPAPAPGLRLGALADGPVVVTEDGAGIAPLVVARLNELGIAARTAKTVPPDACGVVFLGGLRTLASPEEALAVNREAFEAARAFARRSNSSAASGGAGFFVTVQDTGGDFGVSGAVAERVWLGGIAALARTAAREWPSVAVKCVDCERGGRDARSVANAVVGELLTGGPQSDVGLRADGTRVTLRLPDDTAQCTPPTGTGATVTENSVIIAAGGTRGVTAAALYALAEVSRPKIVLIGRSSLPDEHGETVGAADEAALRRAVIERGVRDKRQATAPADVQATVQEILAAREIRDIRAALRMLRDAGSEVRYLPLDIGDPEAVARALKEVRQDWGPITGLVHGAGVPADGLIADKTDEQFSRVFDTKVAGLRTLLAATREDPLEVLCVFSSVAAHLGSPGQSAYAMASEVLEQVACAEQEARPDCLVKAIAWGPWAGGIPTPSPRRHFRQADVPFIAFVAELARPGNVRVVIDASEGRSLPGGESPALLAEVWLDRDSHPQLADHQVADVPVLPMALALDWFARMTEFVAPPVEAMVLRDVAVLNEVVLDRFSDEGSRLLIRGTTNELELLSATGTVHYRARLSGRDGDGSAGGRTPVSALAPLGFGSPAPYGGRSLFHGPDFQSLVSVHTVTPGGADATVAGAKVMGWPENSWILDPAEVDAAFQLAVLWAEQAIGGPSLPMGIERVEFWRRGLLDGLGRCEVRPRRNGPTHAECDVMLFDAEGSPRLRFTGLSLVLRPEPATPAEPGRQGVRR